MIRRLAPGEWQLLRTVRLHALEDAPYAFGSSFAEEVGRGDDWWRASTTRLAWFVATTGPSVVPVGLVAGLPAAIDDPDARAVISMWVDAPHRGKGVAALLLDVVERWARAEGATALVLRVSDRNERAARFYVRRGFVPTGDAEPLRSDPSALAVEMRLTLPRARLRFAASSSGDLHVGHVRNAVLTEVLARQLSGSCFVRFEDTDEAKRVVSSRAAILADLEWLGLVGPEAPRDQLELTDVHREALEVLANAGWTYRDGSAMRFRIPADGSEEWDDMVRGRVAVRNGEIGDPVLVRSSGRPTFHLASTVDDIADAVTHIVRIVPMLRVTAAQRHIWRALGARPPAVGHAPPVSGPGGSPLRVGTGEGTIRSLRELGISPVALLIYLAMPQAASWKVPPVSLDEIVDDVELRGLPRRPFIFDPAALERLNRRHARVTADLDRNPDRRRHSPERP